MRTTILLLSAALAGCAALHKLAPAGSNDAVTIPAADGQKLADDAAARLVALYPPALTRLTLRHAATDQFGRTLLATLREKGYALQEYRTPRKGGAVSTEGGRAFSYVFDQPAEDMYRMTLNVGDQSLSRVYRPKDGTLAAAGAWVRKE